MFVFLVRELGFIVILFSLNGSFNDEMCEGSQGTFQLATNWGGEVSNLGLYKLHLGFPLCVLRSGMCSE